MKKIVEEQIELPLFLHGDGCGEWGYVCAMGTGAESGDMGCHGAPGGGCGEWGYGVPRCPGCGGVALGCGGMANLAM